MNLWLTVECFFDRCDQRCGRAAPQSAGGEFSPVVFALGFQNTPLEGCDHGFWRRRRWTVVSGHRHAYPFGDGFYALPIRVLQQGLLAKMFAYGLHIAAQAVLGLIHGGLFGRGQAVQAEVVEQQAEGAAIDDDALFNVQGVLGTANGVQKSLDPGGAGKSTLQQSTVSYPPLRVAILRN